MRYEHIRWNLHIRTYTGGERKKIETRHLAATTSLFGYRGGGGGTHNGGGVVPAL